MDNNEYLLRKISSMLFVEQFAYFDNPYYMNNEKKYSEYDLCQSNMELITKIDRKITTIFNEFNEDYL